MKIQLCDRWNSVPVSYSEGQMEKQTFLAFHRTRLFLILSPKGQHMQGKTSVSPRLLLCSFSSGGSTSLRVEFGERKDCSLVSFVASVWNTSCLSAQWAFRLMSPLRQWLVATWLRAVRCRQKAHCVHTYKPNSPVSFISNQPDILIFSFLHISVGIRPEECNFIFWTLQTSEADRIKSGASRW